MRFLQLNLGLFVIGLISSGALSQTQTQSDIVRDETLCTQTASRIMILGSYHMDNPGLDAVNLDADDVLSPRRQAEIADLLDKLARFKPTKIAIEAQYKSTYMPNLYKRYLAGEYKLGRNEIEQIGFQLGKRLNFDTVYPVDFPMYMSGLTDSEIEYPKPKPDSSPPKPAKSNAALSEEDQLLRRSTVTEFLRYLNDEKRIQNSNATYMQMLLPNDNPAIYARADLVTNWYKRNLRIFANLSRITDFGKDRILLIIGAGHLKILRGFAIDSPNFCLVDTQLYLR